MSDIKPKLSLRSGVNIAEKSPSPSPSTKLMLNHGKPNFTINKSKSNGDSQNAAAPVTPEAAKVVLKNTTFSGYVKPSNLKLSTENEVEKIVLRRTKLPETNGKSVQQDDEPEFIKAQRKIAERLANQSNLDFESRKSGYFTHVMMSPTSPSKTTEFSQMVTESITSQKPSDSTVVSGNIESVVECKKTEVVENGKLDVEKPEISQENETSKCQESHESEELKHSVENKNQIDTIEAAKALVEELVHAATKRVPTSEEVPKETNNENENKLQNGHVNGEQNCHENGLVNGKQNGESQPQENGHADSCLKSDVNFEPKTVVSFSKELSSEPNKYPDTVKITSESKPVIQDEFLQDMYKLKFDIHADSEDVKVTPTIRTE